MYSVYKITNLFNQKSYIGSSTRVEKRWQQHKNDAFNPNNEKYNYPLYQAFRKYGVENFSFTILKDDFSSLEEMQEFEKNSIIAHNTLSPNGYNQTLLTSSNTIASENTQKHIEKISKKCALVDENNNILYEYGSATSMDYLEFAEKYDGKCVRFDDIVIRTNNSESANKIIDFVNNNEYIKIKPIN